MEYQRFVRITHRDDQTQGGTGYLVTGDRILTAKHVVDDLPQALAIHFDDLAGTPQIEFDVRIEWEGPEGFDVAILALERNFHLPVERLLTDSWADRRPWQSRGWAQATIERDDQGIVANMTALSGHAYGVPPGGRHCELTVDAAPGSVEWWKGASGAPVFIEKRLAGVIHEGSRPFDGGRLLAVPLFSLWPLDGFQESLGIDARTAEEADRQRRELLGKVAAILKKSDDAAAALAAEDPLLGEARDSGRSGAVAEALIDHPSWRAAVNAIDRAHQGLFDRSPNQETEGERILFELTNVVLPWIYSATDLRLIPWGNGGQLITLPFETQTLAELVVAALDRRSLDYVPPSSKKQYPRGRARIAEADEQLDSGFDFTGELAFRLWLKELVDVLEPEPAHVRAVSAPERWRELASLANQQIEFDIREGERRPYFIFSESFARDNASFLGQLAEHLPALHRVQLRLGGLLQEREELAPLRRILFRSTQRRKPNP